MINNKIISDRMRELNKSQKDLATLLNVPGISINRLLNGMRTLRGDELVKVANFLQYDIVDFAKFIAGEDIVIRNADAADLEDVRIPYYNISASAGNGLYSGTEYIQSFLRVSLGKFADKIPNIKHASAITVAGDSMEPNLSDGDIILVDTSARNVIDGKIYIVNIKDELYVKRLFRNPTTKKLTIKSDNSLYPTYEVDSDEVRVCGRLIMKVFQNL